MKKIVVFFLAFAIASFPAYSSSPLLPASSSLPAATTINPDPSTVSSAIDEFRSLSKKERKNRIEKAKRAIREYKAERKRGLDSDVEPWVLIVLAILLPPLAVYLY